MNKTTVKFKKLDERAQMPHYGTEFAAGADFVCVSGCTAYHCKRSNGICPYWDCDGNSYRTCRTCVCKKRAVVVENEERIAQMVIAPYLYAVYEEVNELDETST